jgi:hypothetical protein
MPFAYREGITASVDLRLQYACMNHFKEQHVERVKSS